MLMRFVRYRPQGDTEGLAVATGSGYVGLGAADARFPGTLQALIAQGGDSLARAARLLTQHGRPVDVEHAVLLPPIGAPSKIICVGLNYVEHSAESGFKKPPDYPTIFARFPSSLIGHGAPLLRPRVSTSFDYEGELAVVIGTAGRRISRDNALAHVAGYSVFNDGSIRDYQTRTPQWTIGKNFDGTGAFGPALVTPDELPPGGRGCRLQTRVNGTVLQSASTDDMIFDVATLIQLITEALTLVPGDVLVTGTPAGCGFARKPPIFMKAGDVCEIEIEHVGLLRNPVIDEVGP